MAISAYTTWRIRTDGDDTNGSGFDATISGAGTDYSDQAAAQLSLTDVATTGTTTVTSATGGFTSAMIGNCIRIAGDGYYFITARSNTNTITVDRATGTGSGQSAKVGGAWLTLTNQFGGPASFILPSLTNPVTDGNTVYIRGSGSDMPTSDDYVIGTNGDLVSSYGGSGPGGIVKWIGYNGRPRIKHSGIVFYNTGSIVLFDGIYFILHVGAGYKNFGIGASGGNFRNCVSDINGNTSPIAIGCNSAINCLITNTGSISGNAGYGIYLSNISGVASGNVVENQSGVGIFASSYSSSIFNNIIRNNNSVGVYVGGYSVPNCIVNNTIYGNAIDGILLISRNSMPGTQIMNNIIANNGGYGLNVPSGDDLSFASFIDYNNYYGNTSGSYNNISAGAHDTNLDPQFTDAASGDFTVGTNMKAIGFPQAV